MTKKKSDLASDILDAVQRGTKQWTRTIKAEERRPSLRSLRMSRMTSDRGVSLKEAAAEVMERAYLKASGDGRLPANARQIMYAARPHIQKATGRELGIIVCERCLQAGDIDARIKWNIDGLTRYAAKLQTLVGRLKVPTFAEWEAAEQAIGLRENPNEPIPEGIQGSHDSLVPF